MSVFAVFLAVVAGLMALALIVLFVTMVVLALRGRSRGVRAPQYRND
jgi:hypothetical protein